MVAQKNIIKKVEIRVNTPSLENGTHLKDGLDAFFKEQIFPEMENYFNSIQKNDSKIIRIENISIEINIEEKNSFNELKSLIMTELYKIIKKSNLIENKSGNFQIISSEQNEIEAFFFFLKNGSLPWWFNETNNFWDELIEKIYFKNDISEKLKSLLSISEIRKRLIFQFEDKQLFHIVSSVLDQNNKSDFPFDFPKIYRFEFWDTLIYFSIFKSKEEVIENFQSLPFEEVEKLLKIADENFGINIPLKTIDFVKIKQPNKDSKEVENSEKIYDVEISEQNFKNKKDGIFMKNAGLIILHPFLKMFFEKLDFLLGKNINPEKIDEAIHVLHYLSTGKEKAYEHELLIEKFLCNVPLQQPINRHISLSKDQKIACEVLLQAVLGHWSFLKSNSTEIIQNEFLQREGKLIISQEKQTLIVERKVQDILLDKLPWNIHLIKIPWKEKILFVEW